MAVARELVVLLDLFGTLVPGGDAGERDDVSRLMAAALGVDGDRFAALVRRTFDDRTRGRLGDLRETVVDLAGRLGASPGPDAVEEAVRLRLELTRGLLARTWAVPVLAELAQRGIPVGVVTDCSAETPAVWPGSPLAAYVQATSFSCRTGHRKPEPAAYLTAVRGLGAEPERCWYVGDGGSHELSGARALGMSVVRFGTGGGPGVVDADVGWSGRQVHELAEILPLVLAARR